MPGFEITMRGESREVYYIEAETEDEAREFWSTGQLMLSENTSMEFDSIEELS